VSTRRAEERLVTVGQSLHLRQGSGGQVDDLVEITTGLKIGERVATSNVNQLVDGARVAATANSTR
jgi:hypothetical protein